MPKAKKKASKKKVAEKIKPPEEDVKKPEEPKKEVKKAAAPKEDVKKSADPDLQQQVDELQIYIIDGIDKEISAKLKRMQIITVRDFVDADEREMHDQTKMPLHKVIELQKKAKMMLNLLFESDIVNMLAAKDYTIQSAIEEEQKIMMEMTSKKWEDLEEFVEDLKEITIYLDAATCRDLPISIVPHARKIKEEPPAVTQ